VTQGQFTARHFVHPSTRQISRDVTTEQLEIFWLRADQMEDEQDVERELEKMYQLLRASLTG
jgi:hypothetical protein